MNLYNSLFLGLVQGLTEFLPVSSSGHLVLFQSLIPGFSQPGILFDVILHLGTLFSVLIYFRKKLLSYFNIKYIKLLLIGTLPAVFFGFLFKDFLESTFSSILFLGLGFVVTGILNIISDYLKEKKVDLNYQNSFIVGLFQALAILPSISRSGATIFGGLLMGIPKSKIAEFSFILSIPAIVGAVVLQLSDISIYSPNLLVSYLPAFFVSCLSGLLAINLVFKLLTSKNFKSFGVYCIILGVLTLML